jgi:hypothetical protein
MCGAFFVEIRAGNKSCTGTLAVGSWRSDMKLFTPIAHSVIASAWVLAQAPTSEPNKENPNSTGTTVIPEKHGVLQPQGYTGPINTGSRGGAPAESPQGQTPPGMQSAPEGSSKTIVDEGAKK